MERLHPPVKTYQHTQDHDPLEEEEVEEEEKEGREELRGEKGRMKEERGGGGKGRQK